MYWIWFSLIKNLGSRRKLKLLEIYKTPERIYNLNKKELIKIPNIGEKLADYILDKSIRENLDKHIESMIKNDVDILPKTVES